MTKYNFTVKRGDTWQGVQFQLIRNGQQVNLEGVQVSAGFRHKTSGRTLLTMTTGNNRIQVTYPEQGIFVMAPQQIAVQPGLYEYDVQIAFPDGSLKTYIEGTMTVVPDITP